MPKPVFLMTVQEAHKEYSSLMDQIRAKYEHVSQLCLKLNLPPPKELYRSMLFRHWRCLLDQNYTRQAVCFGYGGCSFVSRYLRITGLLSAPLVLRIGDWLCILPAITLVVEKCKKVKKLPPWTDWWWSAKSTRWKAFQIKIAFPPGRVRGPVYRVQYIVFDTFDPFDMSNEMNNSTLYAVLCKSHKHHFRLFRLE